MNMNVSDEPTVTARRRVAQRVVLRVAVARALALALAVARASSARATGLAHHSHSAQRTDAYLSGSH